MRSRTVAVLWPSHVRFTWQSASSFPAIPVYPGTQWISVSIPISRRVLGLWLIHLAQGCPGHGSRCSVHRMAACELLKTATFVTLCVCGVSLFPTDSQSTSPIAHSSASQISVVWCRGDCGRPSSHLCDCILQQLPLCRRQIEIYPYTISRPLRPLWPLSLLRSVSPLLYPRCHRSL